MGVVATGSTVPSSSTRTPSSPPCPRTASPPLSLTRSAAPTVPCASAGWFTCGYPARSAVPFGYGTTGWGTDGPGSRQQGADHHDAPSALFGSRGGIGSDSEHHARRRYRLRGDTHDVSGVAHGSCSFGASWILLELATRPHATGWRRSRGRAVRGRLA